jgi:hypothetical protein
MIAEVSLRAAKEDPWEDLELALPQLQFVVCRSLRALEGRDLDTAGDAAGLTRAAPWLPQVTATGS